MILYGLMSTSVFEEEVPDRYLRSIFQGRRNAVRGKPKLNATMRSKDQAKKQSSMCWTGHPNLPIRLGGPRRRSMPMVCLTAMFGRLQLYQESFRCIHSLTKVSFRITRIAVTTAAIAIFAYLYQSSTWAMDLQLIQDEAIFAQPSPRTL
jgi:hypothetical protein